MREVSRQTGTPSDEPYRFIVVKYLNIVLGKASHSQVYWNDYLRKEVQIKFPDVLTDEEQHSTYSLLSNINVSDLIER